MPDVHSALKHVRVVDTAPQAWRNGGGSTRELLAWPAGADWRVRVSVAEIGADGPFSAFDGVERWFAVLSGAGVVLSRVGCRNTASRRRARRCASMGPRPPAAA